MEKEKITFLICLIIYPSLCCLCGSNWKHCKMLHWKCLQNNFSCVPSILLKKLVSVLLKVGNGGAREMVLELSSIQLEGITGLSAPKSSAKVQLRYLSCSDHKADSCLVILGAVKRLTNKRRFISYEFELKTSYLIGFKWILICCKLFYRYVLKVKKDSN